MDAVICGVIKDISYDNLTSIGGGFENSKMKLKNHALV
jgi:hypothetical protein